MMNLDGLEYFITFIIVLTFISGYAILRLLEYAIGLV